jgi:hypothetical protein
MLRLASGELHVTTIVTDGDDRAYALARKQVRLRSDVDAYVIATRSTTNAALSCETATRGDQRARRLVCDPLGHAEDQELASVPTALAPVDPWALNWGPAKPDQTQADKRLAVHVVNHDLSDENARRTLRFLQARVRSFAKNLPPDWQQAVFIDDRGQRVPEATSGEIRRSLASTPVRFASGD